MARPVTNREIATLRDARAILVESLATIDAQLAPATAPAQPVPQPSQRAQAQAQGYSGDACTTCGNFKLRRAGTCLVCDDCGTTTGCS